jgi:peptide/nickel transport system permease protein
MAGGERATPVGIAEARKTLGLDQPLVIQFVRYVGAFVSGDLGVSYRTHRPVLEDLTTFFPATLQLIVPALLLGLLIGIPMGLIAGANTSSRTDTTIRLSAIFGAALPAFWVGMILQLVLGSWLRWLPVGGAISVNVATLHPIAQVTGVDLLDAALQGNWVAFSDVAKHMLLPVISLAIFPISLVARMTRASVEEVVSESFVTTARASGLPQRRILFQDVLKNAISPTLTVIGLAFASAFTGTLLVEVVFAWPGIGPYVEGAILSSDFAAIQGAALLGATLYIAINLMVDIAQAVIDPRITAASQ